SWPHRLGARPSRVWGARPVWPCRSWQGLGWCCAQHPPSAESHMTTEQKIARRKLSLLELASDLGNVSKACKVIGYSRQQFYEIRRNFQTYGAEGLLDKIAGARPPHPNRVGEDVEQTILDHSLAHPCHGALRV